MITSIPSHHLNLLMYLQNIISNTSTLTINNNRQEVIIIPKHTIMDLLFTLKFIKCFIQMEVIIHIRTFLTNLHTGILRTVNILLSNIILSDSIPMKHQPHCLRSMLQKNQSNGPNTQVSMSPSFSCVRSGSNFGGQQNQKFPKKSKNYSNRNAKANSQLNAFSTPFRHPRQQYHTGGFDWDMTHKPNNEVSQGVENVAPLPSHLSTSIGTFAATSSSSSMSSANSNFYSRDS
jgi:hypothetical protein